MISFPYYDNSNHIIAVGTLYAVVYGPRVRDDYIINEYKIKMCV